MQLTWGRIESNDVAYLFDPSCGPGLHSRPRDIR